MKSEYRIIITVRYKVSECCIAQSLLSRSLQQDILTVNVHLTHLCRMDSSTFILRTGPFSIKGMSGWCLLSPCFIGIPVFNAKKV